jgi:hypothetical protein
MIESVPLPFGRDTEGDVSFESPEQVFDLHALSDAHDGVEVVRHGQGDQRRPAALFLKPRRRFEDDTPAAGIIEMTYSSVLMAKGYKYGVGVAGPGGASMGE